VGNTYRCCPSVGNTYRCCTSVGNTYRCCPSVGNTYRCCTSVGNTYRCTSVGNTDCCCPSVGNKYRCCPSVGNTYYCCTSVGNTYRCCPSVGNTYRCCASVGNDEGFAWQLVGQEHTGRADEQGGQVQGQHHQHVEQQAAHTPLYNSRINIPSVGAFEKTWSPTKAELTYQQSFSQSIVKNMESNKSRIDVSTILQSEHWKKHGV